MLLISCHGNFSNTEVMTVCTNINILTPLPPSLQITESCRSCVCGHVFEDAKEIGGKRFSGRLPCESGKTSFYMS